MSGIPTKISRDRAERRRQCTTQLRVHTFPEWLRDSTIRTRPLRRSPFRIPLTSLGFIPSESQMSFAVHLPLISITSMTCLPFLDLAAAICFSPRDTVSIVIIKANSTVKKLYDSMPVVNRKQDHDLLLRNIESLMSHSFCDRSTKYPCGLEKRLISSHRVSICSR